MYESYQKKVRLRFFNATLKTDGFLYWVESEQFKGEIIGARCSEIFEAWKAAESFSAAR